MIHTVYYNNLQTPFLSNSIDIILIFYKQCIPRSNYPAAINETLVLALNHISLLMWRVLLMVKYVLTMLNIGFTKNNVE